MGSSVCLHCEMCTFPVLYLTVDQVVETRNWRFLWMLPFLTRFTIPIRCKSNLSPCSFLTYATNKNTFNQNHLFLCPFPHTSKHKPQSLKNTVLIIWLSLLTKTLKWLSISLTCISYCLLVLVSSSSGSDSLSLSANSISVLKISRISA